MMEVIGADNPVKANRFKSAVSKFCKFLILRQKIYVNPTVSLPTYKEESDKRHLLEGELKDFFKYLREESQMGDTTRDLAILYLLTGCRLNELRQLHLSEISVDYITIPPERVKKSYLSHIIPLVPTAKAILDKYSDNKGLIFVNKLGGLIGNETVTQALYSYCQLKDVERFSTHDLRRTVGTHLAMLRVAPFIRKKILGHKDPDVTEDVYTIYDYLPEKREALLKLEHKLLNLGLEV
jgi:integrase